MSEGQHVFSISPRAEQTLERARVERDTHRTWAKNEASIKAEKEAALAECVVQLDEIVAHYVSTPEFQEGARQDKKVGVRFTWDDNGATYETWVTREPNSEDGKTTTVCDIFLQKTKEGSGTQVTVEKVSLFNLRATKNADGSVSPQLTDEHEAYRLPTAKEMLDQIIKTISDPEEIPATLAKVQPIVDLQSVVVDEAAIQKRGVSEKYFMFKHMFDTNRVVHEAARIMHTLMGVGPHSRGETKQE